ERYIQILDRRCEQRIPAAYLTGEAWLQGQRFLVDPRVIIPRSPIAELLAESLHPWVADPESITRALDLCTGSGCLAILTAGACRPAPWTARTAPLRWPGARPASAPSPAPWWIRFLPRATMTASCAVRPTSPAARRTPGRGNAATSRTRRWPAAATAWASCG